MMKGHVTSDHVGQAYMK